MPTEPPGSEQAGMAAGFVMCGLLEANGPAGDSVRRLVLGSSQLKAG